MNKTTKSKPPRTGLGTGQACMGLNIKRQEDCPFLSEYVCLVNGFEMCNLDHCKLKEFGRIIVNWVEQRNKPHK